MHCFHALSKLQRLASQSRVQDTNTQTTSSWSHRVGEPVIDRPRVPALQSGAAPIMRIPVFAVDANPSIDQMLLKKSSSYCEAEVAAGRARQLDDNDIRKGIQIVPTRSGPKTDIRGSKEQSGCLTARESLLNADYAGTQTDVALLARNYEDRLEHHILQGRKGTPRACDVIAARVKTILTGKSL
jgi:hypothetical protein